MNSTTARYSAAAALIASTVPALGADWGGREVYRTNPGVAVPAPVPIPEFRPSWYFRFDAGLGVVSDPSIGDNEFDYGGDFGLGNAPGPLSGPADPRYSPSTWFDSDFNTFLTVGGGVGYYFGRGFRMDATIEKRSKDDVTVSGDDEWDSYGYDCVGCYVPVDGNVNGIADERTRLTINETSKLDGTLWMANAYYDLHHGGRFTPYIGAGIGFAWNEISRNRTGVLETCNNESAPPAGCAGGSYTQVGTMTATDKTEKVSLAAAAMAGFSYNVTDMTSVDIGYRYLYIQGIDTTMTFAGEQTRLEIGDQHVHQVRAGLRFDVD